MDNKTPDLSTPQGLDDLPQGVHDSIWSFFDENFRLSDFFDVEPDSALWQHPSDIERDANPWVVEDNSSHSLTSDSSNDQNAAQHSTEYAHPSPPSQQILNVTLTQDRHMPSSRTKSKPFTEVEWETIYGVVLPIYLEKSRKEILEILSEKLSLSPSQKQLKKRIQLWHENNMLPRKNIDKDDMDYMISVAHRNKELHGLRTVFTHYGFRVTDEKLQKHEKRPGVTHRELHSEAQKSHIEWTTVPFYHAPHGSATTATPRPSQISDPPSGADELSHLPQLMPTTQVPISASTSAATMTVTQTSNADSTNNHDAFDPEFLCDSISVKANSDSLPILELFPDELNDFVMDDRDDESSVETVHPAQETPEGIESCLPSLNSMKTSILFAGNSSSESLGINPFQQAEVEHRSMTTGRLSQEVMSIYANVQVVEAKCISVIRYIIPSLERPYDKTPQKLNKNGWQALVALHRILLHEYRDFLLATQHPSASVAVKRLTAEYAIPVRTWKHGCQSLLELLRRHLPDSEEYLVDFISIARRIYVSFCEASPALEDTWAEYLGTLARYMRDVTAGAADDGNEWLLESRIWYNAAIDTNPSEGRLYHHLATVSQPDSVERLYYLSRSLTSDRAFLPARETMLAFLEHCSRNATGQNKLFAEPISTHFSLFLEDSSEARRRGVNFLRAFRLPSAWSLRQWYVESTQIAVINITSLLGYGNQTPLRYIFELSNHLSNVSSLEKGTEIELPEALREPQFVSVTDILNCRLRCDLLFGTFETICSSHNSLVLPHLIALMTFLVSFAQASVLTNEKLASVVFDTKLIFERVPWRRLCEILNWSLFDKNSVPDPFPNPNTDKPPRPLPEDYLLRGLIWTSNHFPSNWFEPRVDLEYRSYDSAFTSKLRLARIQWLAHRLCFYGYMSLENGVFSESSHSFEQTNVCPSILKTWIDSHIENYRSQRNSELGIAQGFGTVTTDEFINPSQMASLVASPSS